MQFYNVSLGRTTVFVRKFQLEDPFSVVLEILLGISVKATVLREILTLDLGFSENSFYTYFGSSAGTDDAAAVVQTYDGGYAVCGVSNAAITTISGKSPIIQYNALNDFLVIKMNATGSVDWFTFLGSSGNDQCLALSATDDGGVIVGGTAQFSIAVLNNKTPIQSFNGGSNDFLVTKLSSTGTVDWYTFLGSNSGLESLGSVKQTTDGGYLIGGNTFNPITSLGNTTPINPHSGAGNNDWLILKLNRSGLLQWFTLIGSVGAQESVNSLSSTPEGGFIVFGDTTAGITSVAGITPIISYQGSNDNLTGKFDSSGKLIWITFLGGPGSEQNTSGGTTQDGGAIVAGYATGATTSLNGKFPLVGYGGGGGGWCIVVKLTSSGSVDWFTFLGNSSGTDVLCNSASQTGDNGFILSGNAQQVTSIQGILPTIPGVSGAINNLLAAKLNSSGSLQWYSLFGNSNGNTNGKGLSLSSDGGFILTGQALTNSGITNLDGQSPIISNSGGGTNEFLVVKIKRTGHL
ncbi:MAG: hypothetical protein K8R21_02395 [Leptospira sp.]|nr:hypothetical protein [Leptospira sp.]